MGEVILPLRVGGSEERKKRRKEERKDKGRFEDLKKGEVFYTP